MEGTDRPPGLGSVLDEFAVLGARAAYLCAVFLPFLLFGPVLLATAMLLERNVGGPRGTTSPGRASWVEHGVAGTSVDRRLDVEGRMVAQEFGGGEGHNGAGWSTRLKFWAWGLLVIGKCGVGEGVALQWIAFLFGRGILTSA